MDLRHLAPFLLAMLALWSCHAAGTPAPDRSDPLQGAAWLTTAPARHPLEPAAWRWVAQPGTPAPTTATAAVGDVTLRATFALDAAPAAATLWLAADNHARVAVNGHDVGTGDDWATPVSFTVGALLRAGDNRLDFVATNDGGPAGVLAAIEVVAPSGARVVADWDWTSDDGEVVVLGPAATAPWRWRAPDGPCPIVRHEFVVDGVLRSARLAMVGLGHFELLVNGVRASDAVIEQPWSQYDRRIFYREFDLGGLLHDGPNVLAVLLGNGFWRVAEPPPGRWSKGDAMPDFSDGRTWLWCARADLEYADGRRQAVVTGPDWRTTAGPLTLSHIYGGEDYDARRWPEGWDRPGFDDSGWQPAVVTVAPAAELSPCAFPLIEPHQTFAPIALRELGPGRWSYSFAQNCSALLRFTVRGPAGAVVEFKPSEVITEAGVVEQLNLHGREALWRYTLRGGAAVTHQVLFHYHGCQHVQMRGAVPEGRPNPHGLPVVESLELVHVRAANPDRGQFAAADPLYVRTHDLVDWAMRSNMSYVLTDCPHREKLGWLECAHLLARCYLYRFDCTPWLAKIAQDIGDAQLDDGRILTVAPRYLMRDRDDAYAWTVEWGAAGVLLPYELYLWNGDLEALRRALPTMTRFVDHVASVSEHGIAPGALGDWYDYGHGQSPGPSRFTPTDLTATACQALCIRAVRESARALGMAEVEARYAARFEQVRTAFLAAFYDSATATLRNHGSPQTAHAMALCADLVPAADRARVLDAILTDLEARGWQQTAGDVGHLFLIRALAEAGRSDVLHRVYSRTSTGSYGGILAKGLTTMPETWDAITVGSNSLNHCMLGHVIEWFYGWVLGVRQPPDSVGWRRAWIAPEPGELRWCRGQVMTPFGELHAAWRIDAARFTLTVEVPRGTAATALVPPGFDGPASLDGAPASADLGALGRRQVVLGDGRHQLTVAR